MAYFCHTKVNILKGFRGLFWTIEPILNRLEYSEHSTGTNQFCQYSLKGLFFPHTDSIK